MVGPIEESLEGLSEVSIGGVWVSTSELVVSRRGLGGLELDYNNRCIWALKSGAIWDRRL